MNQSLVLGVWVLGFLKNETGCRMVGFYTPLSRAFFRCYSSRTWSVAQRSQQLVSPDLHIMCIYIHIHMCTYTYIHNLLCIYDAGLPHPHSPAHPTVSPLACQVGDCLVWPCCFPRLVLFGLVPPLCGVGPVVFFAGPAPHVSTEVWYGCCRLLVVMSSLHVVRDRWEQGRPGGPGYIYIYTYTESVTLRARFCVVRKKLTF